jgi:hypothetical protein
MSDTKALAKAYGKEHWKSECCGGDYCDGKDTHGDAVEAAFLAGAESLQAKLDNLSAVLRQVWRTAPIKHRKLITDALNAHGNPGEPLRSPGDDPDTPIRTGVLACHAGIGLEARLVSSQDGKTWVGEDFIEGPVVSAIDTKESPMRFWRFEVQEQSDTSVRPWDTGHIWDVQKHGLQCQRCWVTFPNQTVAVETPCHPGTTSQSEKD